MYINIYMSVCSKGLYTSRAVAWQSVLTFTKRFDCKRVHYIFQGFDIKQETEPTSEALASEVYQRGLHGVYII